MYVEERKNLSAIGEILDQLGVPYKLQDIGDKKGDVFPALICTYRCQELDFDVIIYNIGRWIHVKCMVLDTENLTSQSLLTIYELCLTLNYDLPETTFSVYKKSIFIEIDALVGVDYDDFSAEFRSIGEGIEAFVEILSKQNEIEIKSTKGQISTEATDRPRGV